MKAVSAQEMKRLDELAIKGTRIPGLVLMENAGRGAFEILARRLDERRLRRVLVLCGPGNNGGDGYVIARHLANHGYDVKIVATRPGTELKGDARTNWQIVRNMEIPILHLRPDSDPAKALAGLGPFEAVCDALLGTGGAKDLQGVIVKLVAYANAGSWYRFAVDVPTGVDADSGRILGSAFKADDTATFGLPKLGLLLFPGAAFAGELHVVNISLPAALLNQAAGSEILQTAADVPAWPERTADTYKNRLGHLLLLAGSPGKSGAALLAGQAALRAGTGLCTVATHAACHPSLEGRVPDLMVEKIQGESRPEQDLGPMIAGKTAVAVGPGLGIGKSTLDVVRSVLTNFELPTVVDADGLNVLAGNAQLLERPQAATVITPHPGEMARLLGTKTPTVEADRLGVSSRTARELGVVVVLKGARTIVAHPDGRCAINLSGTPAMAKGGTGDVLTGIVGGLLAMGLSAWDAARLAVFVHGRAGERAEESRGVHGVLASDLVEALPECIRQLSRPE
jgi:NAD(P)H-hydrate epimerase